MARPLSPTTKFILSLPNDLPAGEVVAKAEAAGLPTSTGNVYQVRRAHAGKGEKPDTKESKATEAGKGSKKAKTPKATKTKAPKKGAKKVASAPSKSAETTKPGTKKVPTNAAPAAPKKRGPGRPRKAAAAPKAAPAPKAEWKAMPATDEAAFRSAVSAYAVEYGLLATRAIVEDVGDRIRAAGAV